MKPRQHEKMRVPKVPVCRRAFNMIEVVLGMGLIAFGMISTLGLFPVGLTANRDSIAESYAADSADQFLHYFAVRLKMSDNDYENWTQFGLSLPDAKPGSSEPTAWTEWISDDTTTFWYGGSANEFYKVEQKAAGASAPDFSAVYRVWYEQVRYSYWNDGTVTCSCDDSGTEHWHETSADTSQAMAVNIEVSWPAHLSYANRQKAFYQLEVYKPD